jgi:hypothetical protein
VAEVGENASRVAIVVGGGGGGRGGAAGVRTAGEVLLVDVVLHLVLGRERGLGNQSHTTATMIRFL